MTITYTPIGVIHSPHAPLEGMPIQPSGAAGIQGRVEVYPQFQDGLKDLSGFSHVLLIYHFHRSIGCRLHTIPFPDITPRGVFATRAPKRPNPIGLSIVKRQSVEGTVLSIMDADILDQTPLLDIKPYLPAFDAPRGALRSGWLETAQKRAASHRSDDRFCG